jgi:hypothetical protein
VIGGLELAAGLLVLCWLPVEQAAGEGATDSLVEKDEPEGDAAFVDEGRRSDGRRGRVDRGLFFLRRS